MHSTRKLPRSAPWTLLAAVGVLAGLAFDASSVRAEDQGLSPALKALQGVWTARDDDEVQAKWTVKGKDIKAVVNGTEYLGTVTVDDAAKPHPAFTIDIKEGPGEVEGKAAKGVYKLEGDKLTVNMAHPGNDRPIDFNPHGEEMFLFELTKEKDKGAE